MKTIGVFFGSRSPEHDVSIITGHLIISGLKKLGYKVEAIYIDQEGRWLLGDMISQLKYFTDPKLNQELKNVKDFYIELEAAVQKGIFQERSLLSKKRIIDIAFPAFHGQYGEDGTFQGMCEMLNIPYVGCDTTSSALAMDKVLTKLIYKAEGIPTTEFVHFTSDDWKRNQSALLKEILNNIKLPAVVKPARLGSSIGITKVKTEKELLQAVEVALHYDDKVLVEKAVEPLMDITCAVLGNDKPTTSHLQESTFDSDVFTYEDKYLNDGGAQLGNAKKSIFIPARLDKKTTTEIKDLAIRIYKLFGCNGTSRVDFLYNRKTQKYFANEINTLPGTLYHHLWKASGVELPELLEKLIALAEEHHAKKKELTHTFKSTLLQMANSTKLQMKKG